MYKQSCSIILMVFFMSSSILAQEKDEHETEVHNDQNPELTERGSPNITDSVKRRGTVTQGIVGAEAEENKKLVPEDSAAEKREQESPSNIRLQDEIEEGYTSTGSEPE